MSIEQEIMEVVAKRLKWNENDLSLESNLKEDLKADSIDSVEVLFEIEEMYDIVIEDELAEDINTVGDIVNVVNSLQNT
jgi:acyl carrier protein|tara:strand:+ start:1176 stop:1412 length:237 start_codon:yes stop_codon:yes gene_type:complete